MDIKTSFKTADEIFWHIASLGKFRSGIGGGGGCWELILISYWYFPENKGVLLDFAALEKYP